MKYKTGVFVIPGEMVSVLVHYTPHDVVVHYSENKYKYNIY